MVWLLYVMILFQLFGDGEKMDGKKGGRGICCRSLFGDTTWYLWSNKCDDTSMMGEKQSQKGKEFHSILTTRTFQGVPLSNPLRNVCHLAPKLEGPCIMGGFVRSLTCSNWLLPMDLLKGPPLWTNLFSWTLRRYPRPTWSFALPKFNMEPENGTLVKQLLCRNHHF